MTVPMNLKRDSTYKKSPLGYIVGICIAFLCNGRRVSKVASKILMI